MSNYNDKEKQITIEGQWNQEDSKLQKVRILILYVLDNFFIILKKIPLNYKKRAKTNAMVRN